MPESKKFVLVYQAGIANLFEVDSFYPYNSKSPTGRWDKRVYQGDFRTAEAMARGMMLAGAAVRVASRNVAGDVAAHIWVAGIGDCPFRGEAHPPRMAQA